MPAIRGAQSKSKTRRRRRDIDQVYADVRNPKHLAHYKDTKAVEDLPALGQWYCIECAKWFESEKNLSHHQKSKIHKKRVRLLKTEPYSQKEADAAVGLWTDNGRGEKMAVDSEPNDPTDAVAGKEEDDDIEYNAFFSAYKS